MSRLAHSVYAAPGFAAEKWDLDRRIQMEIREAKSIQHQTGCTWSEALRLAKKDLQEMEPVTYHNQFDR